MLLDGENARRVVQLFADIFADALKLAAASALGALWLVTNDGTGKLRRQRCAFWLLTCFVRRRGGTKRVQFRLDGFKVSVEQIIEQAALLRADLLTALGELVAFEDGNLVRELLNDRLVAVDLSAHGVDLRQQLRSKSMQLIGSHLVEIG